MLQVRHIDQHGALRFKRYQHDRRGLVETLTLDRVVYVRPCFGLARAANDATPNNNPSRTSKPRLGAMWKRVSRPLLRTRPEDVSGQLILPFAKPEQSIQGEASREMAP